MITQPVVYVVDDDPAIIRLLTELVKAIELNVEAYESVEKFLEEYKDIEPGCLVLDVMVPGMSGMELQKRLTAAGSTLPIVFITGHADVRMAVEAMERGAIGFLEKPFRPQELCEKIQSAVRVDVEAWRRRKEQEIATARLAQLTPAERKVADRVIGGKTNKMIAQELGLSTRSVEAHRARLMQRLGIKSRTEFMRQMAAVAPFSSCHEECKKSGWPREKCGRAVHAFNS
jgi:FixJ family two-component response regulator